MKIHIAQEGDVRAVGIEITAMDQMVARSQFFVIVWSRYGPDEKMKNQIATALILKKPIILAVEKGVQVPDELRRQANIIHEIEWTRDDPKTLADGIANFVEVVRDVARQQMKLDGEDHRG